MKILSKLFAVALVVALAVGFTSCKKDCYSCTGDNLDSAEYCEDDLGKIATDLAVTSYEALGGTCSKK